MCLGIRGRVELADPTAADRQLGQDEKEGDVLILHASSVAGAQGVSNEISRPSQWPVLPSPWVRWMA